MESINDLFGEYFATFSVVAGITIPFLMEFLNRIFNIGSAIAKSILAWVVPVLIMYAGWGLANVLEGSFLQGLPYWHPALYGLWAALLANIEWKNILWLKEAVNGVMDWLLKKYN